MGGVQEDRKPLRIFWMTDIHLVDEVTDRPEAPGAIWMERHYYASFSKLRQAVERIEQEQPDLVICTGDVIDRAQPLDTFLREWERIPSPKRFIIGNHDLAIGADAVEEQLGIRDHPVVAGSRFNDSFSLRNSRAAARILLLDTYVGHHGERLYDTCEGTIAKEAFEWLREEMTTCEENLILIFSHNGIGGPEEYFDRKAATDFLELARQIAAQGKRILQLAGHHHVHPTAVVKELQPGLTFVNGVAMVAGETSFINVVEIDAEGFWRLDYRAVGYTDYGSANRGSTVRG